MFKVNVSQPITKEVGHLVLSPDPISPLCLHSNQKPNDSVG